MHTLKMCKTNVILHFRSSLNPPIISYFNAQVQQQMLKALNPALNFDMTNEQIAQMMNQSGFGMVAMPTTDEQQQQVAPQTQVKFKY